MDHFIAYLDKVQDEVCEIKKNFLPEDIDELKIKIYDFEKSSSHSIAKSNQLINSSKSADRETESDRSTYDDKYYSF